jgi:hypothetical protein
VSHPRAARRTCAIRGVVLDNRKAAFKAAQAPRGNSGNTLAVPPARAASNSVSLGRLKVLQIGARIGAERPET